MQITSNLHSNVSRSTRINSSSVHTYIFVCFTLRVFLQGFVTQNATPPTHSWLYAVMVITPNLELVGCEFEYRKFCFWKERTSLISLILYSK